MAVSTPTNDGLDAGIRMFEGHTQCTQNRTTRTPTPPPPLGVRLIILTCRIFIDTLYSQLRPACDVFYSYCKNNQVFDDSSAEYYQTINNRSKRRKDRSAHHTNAAAPPTFDLHTTTRLHIHHKLTRASRARSDEYEYLN